MVGQLSGYATLRAQVRPVGAGRRWRMVVAVAAGIVAVSAAAPTGAAPGQVPGLVVEAGTVSTLAGPDLCAGPSVIDRGWSGVRALAVDTSGRIYFDTGRSDRGVVGTVDREGNAVLVGTGLPGPAASGLPGAESLSPAARLAPDQAGGTFLAVGAGVVLRYGAGGAAVVAGDVGRPGLEPGAGPVGDGGPAAAARFVAVASVASDEAGNLFVAERVDAGGNLRIRVINRGLEPLTFFGGIGRDVTIAPGSIGTVADGPALRGAPPAMAVAGRALYVAATVAGPEPGSRSTAVSVVNLGGAALDVHGVTVAPGAVETVAGGGPVGFGGDGGPARKAAFSTVTGITVNRSGDVLLADAGNHRIRKVDAGGTVTTFAGSGPTGANAGGFNGNDRSALEARLNRPTDVKAAPDGRIYISDQLNNQLRFVDQAGIIHAARGNGLGLTWSCPTAVERGPALPALLHPSAGPASVTTTGPTVYFNVPSLGAVQQVTSPGSVEPVGPPAAFKQPSAVGAGGGRLYVIDQGLRIRNLAGEARRLHGSEVAAGADLRILDGVRGATGGGLAGIVPSGAVAAGPGGSVVFADQADFFAGRVRALDDAGRVATVAERLDLSGCCGQPAGVAVSPDGNVYVSASAPPRVWFVNRGPRQVTVHGQTVAPGSSAVVAGTGIRAAGGDGVPAVEAPLQLPRGVTLDGQGNLYVADAGDHTVRKVDTAGVISTVMGTGSGGFNGDGLKPGLTALQGPTAVAFDSCGNLIVADQGNQRVRRLNLVPSCGVVTPPPPGGSTPVVAVLVVVVTAAVLAGAGEALRRNSRRRRPAI